MPKMQKAACYRGYAYVGLTMRITSFVIDWYDCGLCSGDGMVHEKTTIYRNRSVIRIQQYNGYNALLAVSEHKVETNGIEELFLLLERMEAKNGWKSDYRVRVCDGWSWEARIRFSDKTVKLVEGTVALPPNGMKIAKKIRALLESSMCLIEPRLFGRD